MKRSLQLLVLERKERKRKFSAASELLAPESVVVPDFRDTAGLQRIAETLAVKHPFAGAVADMMLAGILGCGTLLAGHGATKFEPFNFILTFLSGS